MNTEHDANECQCCRKAFIDGQSIWRDDAGLAFCSLRCALLYLGAPVAQLPPG